MPADAPDVVAQYNLGNDGVVRESGLIDGGDGPAAERLVRVVVGHRIGDGDLRVRAVVTHDAHVGTVVVDGEIGQLEV